MPFESSKEGNLKGVNGPQRGQYPNPVTGERFPGRRCRRNAVLGPFISPSQQAKEKLEEAEVTLGKCSP